MKLLRIILLQAMNDSRMAAAVAAASAVPCDST
jgi:hypothetical protein